MNVMNRRMFSTRDARSKLSNMGGIMGSSPELMSAGQQGFANGGQPNGSEFLNAVQQVGEEKAPTYLISSPVLSGGKLLEISAETLSALNSVVPNLVTPGNGIFVAEAASATAGMRKMAKPGDAIIGTRVRSIMEQRQIAPQPSDPVDQELAMRTAEQQGPNFGVTAGPDAAPVDGVMSAAPGQTNLMPNVLSSPTSVDEMGNPGLDRNITTELPSLPSITAYNSPEGKQDAGVLPVSDRPYDVAGFNRRITQDEYGDYANEYDALRGEAAEAEAAKEDDLNRRIAEEDRAFAVDFPQGGARTFPNKGILSLDQAVLDDGNSGNRLAKAQMDSEIAAREDDLNRRIAEEDMAFAGDFPQGGARTFPNEGLPFLDQAVPVDPQGTSQASMDLRLSRQKARDISDSYDDDGSQMALMDYYDSLVNGVSEFVEGGQDKLAEGRKQLRLQRLAEAEDESIAKDMARLQAQDLLTADDSEGGLMMMEGMGPRDASELASGPLLEVAANAEAEAKIADAGDALKFLSDLKPGKAYRENPAKGTGINPRSTLTNKELNERISRAAFPDGTLGSEVDDTYQSVGRTQMRARINDSAAFTGQAEYDPSLTNLSPDGLGSQAALRREGKLRDSIDAAVNEPEINSDADAQFTTGSASVPPIANPSAVNQVVTSVLVDENPTIEGITKLVESGAAPKQIAASLLKLSGYAPVTPGAANTNATVNKNYKQIISDIMGDDQTDKEKSQVMWNNFAMIGFAIAAGQSPDAMSNIAQGMLQGTKLMANQREADRARRDKRKGMEFDLMLADRAVTDDRETKFGVANIRAQAVLDSARLTADAKLRAKTFLDTDPGKGMDKIFTSLFATENSLQTPELIITALQKILTSPAYSEAQKDKFLAAKGFDPSAFKDALNVETGGFNLAAFNKAMKEGT